MKKFVLICILFMYWHENQAQRRSLNKPFEGFGNLILMVDSLMFDSQNDIINVNRRQHLFFQYSKNEQIVRAELFTSGDFNKQIRLLPSDDYNILDSMQLINDEFYAFRIRFKDISNSEFVRFVFEVSDSAKTANYEIPLFPFTQTTATFYAENDDLYLGEPKKFELISNNADNLILDGEWHSYNNFEYRLIKNQNDAFLYLVSNQRGRADFELKLKTKKPYVDERGDIIYRLPAITRTLNTRQSRLTFLRMDQRDVTLDADNLEGYEVQIDNNRNLAVGKTYRIENAEQKGSPLIAEIFTKQLLSNDKMLCILRPYRTHRSEDGYLYIKDGDNPLFITNVSITPKATIHKISILRNGDDWTGSRNVKPGETIDLRIEGESLSKARYFFEDLEDISADTLTRNDRLASYRLKVPLNISKRNLEIYNRNEKTGQRLTVVEHQKARPLDFVLVNYGAGPKKANSLNQPILYPNTIKDLVISFDRHKIDETDMLYGRQYLHITIRIQDKDGGLIETRDLGNFEICPAESSPRHAFYREAGCLLDDILVNNYLSRKTHSLMEWSKIELNIEHVKERYESEGYAQRIVIHNQRLATFDVDVSFPAGLITQKIDSDEGLSPLGGISLAMIAQFSFYKPGEIQQLRPYKVGAGFLAQNAFNFNQDADRDLGIVVLGSVYPIRTRGKLSFPLYGGFGYFLQEGKFFFLVGPGIRVSF